MTKVGFTQSSTLTLLLLIFPLNIISHAKNLDEVFDYQLFTSNVFRWHDGDGRPQDTQQVMAKALEIEIQNSTERVDFAIFGVKQQSWLITQIKEQKNRLDFRAVLDQKKGMLGDWAPSNFVYSDSPLFAETVGFKNTVVDQSRIPGKARSSTMHNKYIIFDQKKVWLGSANLSSSCIGDEYNANSVILINSKALAEVYTLEFNQMYKSKLFSTAKFKHPIDQHLVYKDGSVVDIFFSPQDDPITQGIVPFIERAEKTLDVAIFFLTDQRATGALIKAKKRGVKVRVIQDAVSASMKISLHRKLRENQIPVRIENWGGKMHMKTAIADHNEVVIGSMNWSAVGTSRNDENTLIIRNKKLARELSHYYENLWSSLDFYRYMDPDHLVDPRPEGISSINSCFDGFDNNYNGLVDGEEATCL